MGYGMAFYKNTVYDWLNNQKLRSGGTKHNVTFLREFKDLKSEMSAIMCYLYFLAKHVNDGYSNSMLCSFRRHKKFVVRVVFTLKEKEVTSKYVPGFEREIKQIRERIERCKILAFDNLRLTPYYPFFEQYGYEEVYKLVTIYNKDERCEAQKVLADKCFAWTEAHSDEVQAHMASVQEEIRIKEAHRAKVISDIKAEKEKAKKEEAERKAMEKERIANHNKHIAEYRKLERSFNRYYEGNY